jgi:hypothetical protein
MRVTGVGKPTCDVECIYRLIGKTPYSVTTLKDLKDAAQKSGFSAVGYKLTLTQLQNLNEYAILPIGFAQGTSLGPTGRKRLPKHHKYNHIKTQPYHVFTIAKLLDRLRPCPLTACYTARSPHFLNHTTPSAFARKSDPISFQPE